MVGHCFDGATCSVIKNRFSGVQARLILILCSARVIYLKSISVGFFYQYAAMIKESHMRLRQWDDIFGEEPITTLPAICPISGLLDNNLFFSRHNDCVKEAELPLATTSKGSFTRQWTS